MDADPFKLLEKCILECKMTGISIPDVFERYAEINNIKLPDTSTDHFDHSCIDSNCKKNGNITQIDKNTFVCKISGYTHVCNPNKTCKYVDILGIERNKICYMSGFEIGIKYKHSFYNEKYDDYDIETYINDDNEDYEQNDPSNYHDQLAMDIEQNEENENNNNNDESAKSIKKTELYYNNTEKPRKRKKRIKNIPVGRKKGENSIDKIENTEKRGQKKTIKSADVTFIYKIQNIINDILYNETERERINLKNAEQIEIDAEDEVFKYYKICRKQKSLPSIWEAWNYIKMCEDRKQKVYIAPKDEKRISFYTEICKELWYIVDTYFPSNKKKRNITLTQHVLATLYLLQTRVEIIDHYTPYDEYLFTMLPSENDLKTWTNMKYNESDITQGTNIIKQSILNIPSDIKNEKFKLISNIYLKYYENIQIENIPLHPYFMEN